ncbi:MAG: amidase [Candidatus Entotheonella factor]|uniref:Amidase n=1 Tax=Entotheonella factor TaxID=1429438 RepID=W4LLQ0_ENTF1|nr:MAG: amidase [Candidatus Entotheonella factor]
MLDIPFRSACQLAAAIRQKDIGCLELLDLYLDRIERHNPQLNAVIFMDRDAARERARQADAALAKGEVWGPLHGVPMTIKESYDVVGMPTTWGVPALKDNYPQAHAVSVDRLLRAGVVLFGKTNVPLHLADWQTFNDIYGTTNNPWDVTRVPGGSSGGSAAALAAGLTGLEAGSDIGASIRNPAHYCGVYGHKPTYGIVSPRGQDKPGIVAAADILVVGPLARSADDLAIALEVMAGPDGIDGMGWQLRLPRPRQVTLRDYKVAVMYSDAEAEVDDVVQARLHDVVAFLAQSGAQVSDTARPQIDSREANRNYIQLLRSATSTRLSPEMFQHNLQAAAALSPDDEGYEAQSIRAQAMHHKDWLVLNETRHHMRLAWAEFFQDYDLLLCPATTTAAFPHNQQGERWERMITVNGQPQPSTTQMFWAGYPCNVYLPSTVAPAGLSPDGLPVGVQIVGPQYGDYTCIHFAQLLEREFQAFEPPAGFE